MRSHLVDILSGLNLKAGQPHRANLADLLDIPSAIALEPVVK